MVTVRISTALSPIYRRKLPNRSGVFIWKRMLNSSGKGHTVPDNVEDLSAMRIPYLPPRDCFLESDLASCEPFGQFKEWFDEACRSPVILEPNGMALATSTLDGRPSVRMVLLKGFGPFGFKFFTNYSSRKGRELTENPYAGLMFYWEATKRQVRIEGQVEKLEENESSEYFHSRPQSSQIAAAVSAQSQPVPSREFLVQKMEEYRSLEVIHKPENWGGFVLKPLVFEFWQGQTNRLHDRIRFRKPSVNEVIDPAVTHSGKDGWIYERLAP